LRLALGHTAKANQTLVGKLLGKLPFGSPRIWEDNIETDLREDVWVGNG